MILKANAITEPHPDGIFPGVCVDVIDLGLRESEYNGSKRMVPKVRLVFETQLPLPGVGPGLLATTFTASLNHKARLREALSTWRGRPIEPGEQIDLRKLPGVPCTLLVTHQPAEDGTMLARIDAITRPTRKVLPSGTYDPKAARDRLKQPLPPPAPSNAPLRPPPAADPGEEGFDDIPF